MLMLDNAKLRAARVGKGLNVSAAARAMNMSRQFLVKLERAPRDVIVSTAGRLATQYGVTLDALVTDFPDYAGKPHRGGETPAAKKNAAPRARRRRRAAGAV